MPNLAVIGTHWGDEGKGKIVDLLADRFDIVARFQGGHNAGHSVHTDTGSYAFHLIPSGILRKGMTTLIGNGVVIDPKAFLTEVSRLRDQGLTVDGTNLKISDRAHVITPWHLAYERAAEQRSHLGTTQRGIGPAYVSKAQRIGIRVIDLLNPTTLAAKVALATATANDHLATHEGHQPFDPTQLTTELLELGQALAPHVTDTSLLLHERIQSGQSVLFEGAQATLLDVDHGTYPYVTSSNSCAVGITAGLGIGPREIHGVLAVTKAYTTRVGSGPMPTEQTNTTGETLRERGKEYGVSTGRPRRCGWFDAVAGRYATRVNGVDLVAVTLLDVLDTFAELKIATGYKLESGEVLRHLPADTSQMDQVQVEYETLPGWQTDTTKVRSYDDLPKNAKTYIERLEKLLETPIAIVSVGAPRQATILREERLERWPARVPS